MRTRKDREGSPPVPLLRHLGVAMILWSAVLFGDLTGPATLRHVAANPVLRRSLLLACASFGSVCLAAGLWGVAAAAGCGGRSREQRDGATCGEETARRAPPSPAQSPPTERPHPPRGEDARRFER